MQPYERAILSGAVAATRFRANWPGEFPSRKGHNELAAITILDTAPMTPSPLERRRHHHFRILFADLDVFVSRILGRGDSRKEQAAPQPSLPDPPPAPEEAPEAVLIRPAAGRVTFIPTGVAIIDEQHQQLIDAIQTLQQSLRGESGEAIPDMLAFLHRYLDEHFTYEEAYMEHIGFPGRANHRAEHHYFRLQIQQLEQRLGLGDRTVAMELTSLLIHWLQEHIMHEDAAYVSYRRR